MVSQVLLASKSKDIITTLWPLKPASLVPEVSSCGAVAATWSRDWRVTSRETGKSWKICVNFANVMLMTSSYKGLSLRAMVSGSSEPQRPPRAAGALGGFLLTASTRVSNLCLALGG